MNLTVERNFSCCCSIAQRQFEINGKTIIETTKSVITVPTALTATLGNLLVLISIWRTPALHTPSNVLLVSLALTDLGVGLVAAPIFLVSGIAKIKEDENLYCKTITAYLVASYSLCGISLVTMTAISLERLVALRIHLRYKEIVTVKRLSILSVAIWLLSLLFGALNTWNVTLVAYASIIVIPLCYVFTAFAYCEILRVVRRHQAQIRTQLAAQVGQQEGNSLNMIQYKKSFVNMLLIYLVFLLCYTPYLVLKVMVLTVGVSKFSFSADGLAAALIHINSTVNPFVYCWRFRNVRAAVKETLKRLRGKLT